MATDYGVRQGLKQAGFTDDDIGFDANTGYVQLKNKNTGMYENFIKPELNVQGTTYTSQDNFNNALQRYRQSQQQAATQAANQARLQQVQDQVLNYQRQENPYDTQINNLVQQIMQRVNRPQKFDVYSSPEYAAAQAQTQRQSQEGIRAAQEAFGAAGFGRSTNLGVAAQQEQNRANEYLTTQLVPQIIAQNQAREQQALQNLMSVINPLVGQQNTFDTRQNQEFNRVAEVLNYLTGRTDRAEDIQRQDNRWATEDDRWNKTFDYNKERDDRNFNAEQEYRKWQQDFQTGRAKEQDSQFWAKMEQDAKQAAASQGLQWEQLDQRRKEMAINQEFQKKQTQFGQGMQIFKETGQMPEYMREFGVDPVALNNVATQQDVLALYDQISTGKIKPQDALKIIDDKVKLGAETPQDAEIMKNAIYTLYPDLRPGAEKDDNPASLGFIRPVGMETIGDIENEVGSKVKDAAREYLPRFGEWWIKTFTDSMQGRPFGMGG